MRKAMSGDGIGRWWRTLSAPGSGAIGAWALGGLVDCLGILAQRHMHSVYPIFAHAGRNWRAGSDLYGAAARGSYDLYRYSPLAAACFSLLSAAPDRLGDMVWRVVNAAVFLGGLRCFH